MAEQSFKIYKDTAERLDKNALDIASLEEDIGKNETTLTDIQKKIGDSNSNDGFLLCDLNGNIVGHIASFEVWNNESYNKKYGWGGHPYGNGKLPPYSKIKIYNFKAYSGDKLVKNLVPYRKTDGTVCMLDKISGNYHYGIGSGVFIGN